MTFRRPTFPARILRTHPAGVMLLAALISVLPVLLTGSLRASAFATLGVMVLSALLLPPANACFHAALPAFLAWLAAWNWSNQDAVDPLRKIAGRPAFHAIVRMRVVDPSVSSLPGDAQPRGIVCDAEGVRFSERDAERKVEPFRILLRFRPDAACPDFGYGDVLSAVGSFREQERPLLPGTFDYAEYLRFQGIKGVFLADEAKILERGEGFLRHVYAARDRFLREICSAFRSDDDRAVAAAMLGGRNIGIAPETKRAFLKSGTIHILSVSGTHVAIVAGLLLALFFFLPFRARRLAVLPPLFLYALSTGMREPAIRAFLMLAAFLSFRSFLYRTNPLNTLFFIAFLLILWEPQCVMHSGVHYSFLCVGVLLCVPKRVKAFESAMFPDLAFIPGAFAPKRLLWGRKLVFRTFRAVFACGAVFLAATALTMLHQGLFPVASMAANLVLIPLSSLIFLFAGIAGVSIGIPLLREPASKLLESGFSALGTVCDFFAGFAPHPQASPPVWSVFAFLIALFVFLCADRRAWILAATVALVALPIFWRFRTTGLPMECAVLAGGGCDVQPTVILADPEAGGAILANVPDFQAAKAAQEYLRSFGIGECALLIAQNTDSAYGVRYLKDDLSVRRALFPTTLRLRDELDVPTRRYWRSAFEHAGRFDVEVSKGRFSFRTESLSGRILAEESGETTVLLTGENGETRFRETIPNRKSRHWIRIPLQ